MMDLFHFVLLGVVEGFTEFLPISSTAHLVLASRLLGMAQSSFVKTFEIAIQSGAILAVVFLYWRKFLDGGVLKRLVVAFIPTAVIGFIFYSIVKTYLIGNIAVILWALGLGGIFLILFERWFAKKDTISEIGDISYLSAFGIGVCQSVAMIPGISRAAATIVGGMALGVKRETIVEFSFLLAVPTMLAATGLDIMKSFHEFSNAEFSLLGVGFLVSFITAIISIRFLLHYVHGHTFSAFGVYRILLVCLMIIFLVL